MSKEETKNIDTAKSDSLPSKKHQDFIERYLLHFNASKAYSDTYGVKNALVASANASRLLTDAKVQQYLQRRLAERKAELNVDTNYVIRKLTEIVEADYVDSTQYLSAEELKKIPDNIRKLIQSIEIVKTKNQSRDFENTTEKYKVTFMSKDAAIQALGKHTGAFIKDNITGNFNLDQMSFTDALKKLDI